MNFKEITDQKTWDSFIQSFDFYTFIHSWSWGEFQKLDNSKVFRIGGYEGDKQVLAALVLRVSAKKGDFLLCPHGPYIKDKLKERFQELTKYLKELAKKEKVAFVRIAPIFPNMRNYADIFKENGYRPAPTHVHAEYTWLLDITKNEDELLKDMRSTTRYIVRRALKEGVKITTEDSQEAIETFIEMHHVHSKRSSGRNYTAFSDDFIRNLFKSFPKEDISLKFAKYKGEIEAGAVTIRYGKKAAYYLGASDIKHPKFSPAYLVQWECIREGKEKGCEEYNFWGVTPDDNKNYPLYGVSLFKKGFGGFQHDLLHTHDLPITPRYYLSALIEWFLRKKKGYYYLPSQSKI